MKFTSRLRFCVINNIIFEFIGNSDLKIFAYTNPIALIGIFGK